MARFRYKLQAALDTELAGERAARAAYADAARALDGALGALAELDARRAETAAKLTVSGGTAARELALVDARLAALEAARVRQLERIAGARRALAQARAALESVRRRRSALERHRDRARAAFDAREALRDEAELDEANMTRTIRA